MIRRIFVERVTRIELALSAAKFGEHSHRIPRSCQNPGEWLPGLVSAQPIACDATAGSALVLQPHLVIWLALPLVMAVAGPLLVAVAPS